MAALHVGSNAAGGVHAPGAGLYANYLKVGTSTNEFVLDFGQYYGDEAMPRFHTRIVATPAHIREFVALMQRCLDEHGARDGADGATRDS